jgi:FtsZ-binding cell division protein ZapB
MLHDSSNTKMNSCYEGENTKKTMIDVKDLTENSHVQYKELSREESLAMQKELAELKEKTKTITMKFANVRKERDSLKKENKELQGEVLSLQNSMREMIPSGNNTSSCFPIHNEINNLVTDFLKGDCIDIFFDVLSLELNIEGVSYFYQHLFTPLVSTVNEYFKPPFACIMGTARIEAIEKPVLNVLKKVFQNNWKSIHSTIFSKKEIGKILCGIQSYLKLGDTEGNKAEIEKRLEEFIRKASEICIICYLSEPQLTISTDSITTICNFNSIRHESVDGFLKNKEECIIVLPPVLNERNEAILKAHVLPMSYEFP